MNFRTLGKSLICLLFFLQISHAQTPTDGLFMEVHENPDKALSDGPNSLHLSDLADLLRRLVRIHQARTAPLD